MYNDDPDWIVFFNLMRCLYREHPVKLNIAGTIDSIAKIDTDVLNRCYRAYYRPGNMVFVLAGKMDPDLVSRIIRKDGGNRAPDPKGMLNDRKIIEKDLSPSQMLLTQQMVVARPKVLLGFKEHDLEGGGSEQQSREIMTQMVIEILFGKSSSTYEKLYQEGTIDDTFSAYYSGYLDFGFSILGVDTDTPDRFQDRIREQLLGTLKDGISSSDFERQKNKYLGKFIRTFNSIKSSAYSLLNFTFKGLYPQQVMEIIERITLDDLNNRLRRHLNPDEMVCSTVEPMEADHRSVEEKIS
jgi:predicted Zn-dependent peptidase